MDPSWVPEDTVKKQNILIAAAALALAGCAVAPHTPTAATVAQIQPGVSTRADVDKMLGKPLYSFAQTKYGPESTYEVHDAYGQDTSLTVSFDGKGVVQSTYAERQEDH
jgi:outer membrane protein assembly factor BamE (lipoprotein component of BamABCDE complex)